MTSIEEYTQEAIQDFRWDLSEFQLYAKRISEVRRKWGRYLYNEELETSQHEQNLRQKYVERFKYYKYDSPLSIDTKNIDTFIKGDADYCETEKKLIEQKSKEKFINQILSNIDQQSFILNNILKHMLWEAGN